MIPITRWMSSVVGQEFNVPLTPLTWTNTTNVQVKQNGHYAHSNGGTDNDWTQRNPYTSTTFSDVFSISVSLIDGPMFFGVTTSTDNADHFTDIDYAFYREGNAGATSGLSIWENGVQSISLGIILENTDTLKIMSDGASVSFYRNSVLLYTSLNAPSGTYKFKASLYRNLITSIFEITDLIIS